MLHVWLTQGLAISNKLLHVFMQPTPPRSPTPPPTIPLIPAADLFLPPGRASRPKRFVIILRGLPGSGKTYLAKMLRDLEIKHGDDAPRMHGIDDYFVTVRR